MTYGNRNPNPRPRDEEDSERFTTVRIKDPKTKYGLTIQPFTVTFAAAEFDDPNVRGVGATLFKLADAINEVGFTLQAQELREAAREFANDAAERIIDN